jgi:hypothetical protein
MHKQAAVPAWLWRAANWGLVLLAGGLAALALALFLGAADPPRAGPLRWQDDFKAGVARWALEAPPGARFDDEGGALVVEWASAAAGETMAWALAAGPTGDFTLEVAGASTSGAYGLVFGWQDPAHYSAVLINGSGYAEAYTQAGAERQRWFEWQQWPHILAGAENNRLRVDVRGGSVTARVNDEVLAASMLPAASGRLGVVARAAGPAQVVFSWVRVWAP